MGKQALVSAMGNYHNPLATSFNRPNGFWSDESNLWQDFQTGGSEAFECLYHSHVRHLISYGNKITPDRSLVQDCIQDLFVELWESREKLAPAKSVRHYLLKALRYKIVHHLQTDLREPLEETHFPIQYENAESQWLLSESLLLHAKQLNIALDALPKRQKEAIFLRYFQELSNEEVAQVMGVTYQSACRFIYTALKTLREKMRLLALIPLAFTFFI